MEALQDLRQEKDDHDEHDLSVLPPDKPFNRIRGWNGIHPETDGKVIYIHRIPEMVRSQAFRLLAQKIDDLFYYESFQRAYDGNDRHARSTLQAGANRSQSEISQLLEAAKIPQELHKPAPHSDILKWARTIRDWMGRIEQKAVRNHEEKQRYA